MSELPSGWELTSVGTLASSLVDGPFGSNLKSEHYSDSGTRVIRLQNIGDGYFDDRDKAFVPTEHAERLQRHEASSGDVLIAAMGDVLPRTCLVPLGIGPAIVKADCFRLRPHPGISSPLLSYFLSSPQVRRQASTQISGVGRPRLNLRKVSELTIPLPPSDEQERIIAAIEEQFSRLENGINALERVREQLARMRSAAMERPFADLSSGQMEPLRSVGHVVTGSTPSTSDPANYGGELPFITPANFDHGDHVRSSSRTLSSNGAKLARALPSGSILATCIGATLGKTGLATVPCATNQQINAVIPGDQILSEYLFYCIARPKFVKRMWEMSSSTTMPILNKSKLSDMVIPVVPTTEQSAIVESISKALDYIDRLNGSLNAVFAQSATLRSSILAAAFAGKLVPQDPQEAPASEMVEKIEAVRSSKSDQRRQRQQQSQRPTVKS